MEILTNSLFKIIGYGTLLLLVALVIRLVYYALTCRDVSNFWCVRENDCSRKEDDRRREEPSKPSSPYAGMTDEELRCRAEEAERKMNRMR